jgi:gamma-glutamylcyclotransferase (GGCT)/AIG2-like uncharacterized protein YtfP
MAEVCPGHPCKGRARLPGYRLAFTRRSVRTDTGVADVVEDANATVWGVLHELDGVAMEKLDRKEGAGWAYVRRQVQVYDVHDRLLAAQIYVVAAKSEEHIAPSTSYMARLVRAAEEQRLPDSYVRSLKAVLTAGSGNEVGASEARGRL